MYTFREAVNDTKAFYDCEYFHNLLTEVTGKTMTESDLEAGVLSAYKIMFRVLFKDKLDHLYKKPKNQTDKLLVVKRFGKILIPLMAISMSEFSLNFPFAIEPKINTSLAPFSFNIFVAFFMSSL